MISKGRVNPFMFVPMTDAPVERTLERFQDRKNVGETGVHIVLVTGLNVTKMCGGIKQDKQYQRQEAHAPEAT